MNNLQKVGTFNGIIIYQYDFTNAKGVKIKTAKVLFNINGIGVLVNSTKLTEHKVGNKVIQDLGYDGSKWVVM